MTTLPIPDAVLAAHTAVLGKTGSGKTSTEKLLIEHVVAQGARVCVLDTIKSDWWGITSSASGKHAGLPFKILGGPHGHVPLHSSAGKVIGQLVGSGKLPLSIVDMADFEPGGIQRFFVDFAQALFRYARGVVYLVIEEAHEVAPKERAGFGAENMAIHWAKKLATGARSKGIRLIVATQRVQQLHNGVLDSCETLIAHRLTTPASQEPVVKWMKANAEKATQDEVATSLSSLPTGTAWVCSGEAKFFQRVKFPKFHTYDNTVTPTGDGADVAVKTAAVDADELRGLIGEAVKAAEASDPKALAKALAERDSKIRTLEQQLAAKAALASDPAAIADAEKRALENGLGEGHTVGFADGWNARGAAVHRVIAAIDEGQEVYRRAFATSRAEFAGAARKLAPMPAPAPPSRSVAPLGRASLFPKPRPPLPSATNGSGAGSGDLGKGERIVLTAIAQYPDGAAREQLTVLTGYKRSSRDTYIQRLAAAGYVDVAGDTLRATETGITALGDFEPLPTGAALQDYWLSRLTGGEQKILAHLIGVYPQTIARDDLDEPTGYKRSARDTYIQRLSARRLVNADRGVVRAADILFEAA